MPYCLGTKETCQGDCGNSDVKKRNCIKASHFIPISSHRFFIGYWIYTGLHFYASPFLNSVYYLLIQLSNQEFMANL
jgi:hypothetical protein